MALPHPRENGSVRVEQAERRRAESIISAYLWLLLVVVVWLLRLRLWFWSMDCSVVHVDVHFIVAACVNTGYRITLLLHGMHY
jgi:hypothetical protein